MQVEFADASNVRKRTGQGDRAHQINGLTSQNTAQQTERAKDCWHCCIGIEGLPRYIIHLHVFDESIGNCVRLWLTAAAMIRGKEGMP